MLFEHIKGGLRLAAIDQSLIREGLRIGQNLADARAIIPDMEVREIDRSLLETALPVLPIGTPMPVRWCRS
ncbi:hypothetical protein [Devosia aurantiaca]|uniref:Uncharacterized protein n=1 Tax=Devosia aurantiaca TaxID=2714858 RepID=A0A6M1SUJ5_9HYPH|nr:hypothetical protein [Devosia aurantiaca]NGP16661.1 hypothetical protein [Devosia aurantiaca]